MGHKTIVLDDVGEVILRKRRLSKRLKLTVGHDGQATVSLPYWVPYKLAEEFAKSKHDWLKGLVEANRPYVFKDGESIGKAHRIKIAWTTASKPRVVVRDQLVKVYLPQGMKVDSNESQLAITKGCRRALKNEANQLLPQRLAQAAGQTGHKYKSVQIKQLTSRWGSCSSQKDIVLNSYLMQLPWELIDYVILHELAHTKVMAHGPRFWDELGKYVVDLPTKRKAIKAYSPRLGPRQTAADIA